MATSNSGPDARLDLEPRYSAEEIYRVNRVAQRLFELGLESDEGAAAREHLLEERGLPAWLTEEEGLGYVGDHRTLLTDFASEKDLPLEAFAEAGLVYRSSYRARKAFRRAHGRTPDSDEELSGFFREKLENDPDYYYDYPLCHTSDGERKSGLWLTIPLRVTDDEGRIQIGGFQYRSMRPAEQIGKRGRYMSPVNTRAISWSDTLIGLAEERAQIDHSGRVVLTEGKFDQMAVKAAVRSLPEDVRPGVIALGGASTRGRTFGAETAEERAGILAEINAEHATLFLDADETGTAAVLEVGPLLSALGTHVQIACPEDGWDGPEGEVPKDPGEVLERGGQEAVLSVLRSSRGRGLVTYASRLTERRLGHDARSGQLRQRLEALDSLVPIVRALPDAVRDRASLRVSEVVGLDPVVVQVALDEGDQDGPGRLQPSREARQALAAQR